MEHQLKACTKESLINADKMSLKISWTQQKSVSSRKNLIYLLSLL